MSDLFISKENFDINNWMIIPYYLRKKIKACTAIIFTQWQKLIIFNSIQIVTYLGQNCFY